MKPIVCFYFLERGKVLFIFHSSNVLLCRLWNIILSIVQWDVYFCHYIILHIRLKNIGSEFLIFPSLYREGYTFYIGKKTLSCTYLAQLLFTAIRLWMMCKDGDLLMSSFGTAAFVILSIRFLVNLFGLYKINKKA